MTRIEAEKANKQLVKEIGERMQRAREKAGLSRMDLARRADLHYDTLVKVETGKRGVALATLAQVASALDMSVAALLDA